MLGLPFKITALLFIRDPQGRLLLIQRQKAPNAGFWSPPGGKLDMETGESPFECARREAAEETGMLLADDDLHLFGYVSEKGYEDAGHWLMFLFDVKPPIERLPEGIDEGRFSFFARDAIEELSIPPTDRQLVWPPYDRHRQGFVALRANCQGGRLTEKRVEQVLGPMAP